MTVMGVPRLHLIGPLGETWEPAKYAAIALEASRGGVDAVHVRMPGSPGGDVLEVTRMIQDTVTSTGAMVIVNDRVDVGALLHTGGVHLGERSVSVGDARILLSQGTLVGRSIHDVQGAIQAEQDGADYIIAGHIFDTGSKAGVPGRGLEWLSDVIAAVSIPVIAIGGITAERAGQVISLGASGVAIGREILEATDPADSAARISLAMELEEE
jgi:thiamine-phosphate diphosphorylase